MATNPFDQFDAPEANPFDQFDKPADKKSALGDLGRSLKSGVQQLPGMVTGIADLVPALAFNARPFTKAADAIGDVTGFQPGKWAKDIQYSQGYQDSQKSVDEAWKGSAAVLADPNTSKMDYAKKLLSDAPDIALEYLKNPMYSANQVVQSAPAMIAGGIASKGLMAAGRVAGVGADAAAGISARQAIPGLLERTVGEKLAAPIAGGAGEGLMQIGQQMDNGSALPDQRKNAVAALGSGVMDALITTGAGRLANKMGFETMQTAMAKAGDGKLASGVAIGKRMAGGAITEGLMQELPQSMQEQVWQNYAEGKPLMEGVVRQGLEGAISGAVMGAGANVMGGQQANTADTPPAKPMGALEQAASLAKDLPLTQEGAQKQADAKSTAEGKPYEVAPHDEVAGRFKTQPLTEAVDAATPSNNVDTQLSPLDMGRTGIDDRLPNDNQRGSAAPIEQPTRAGQDGALAATDGVDDAGTGRSAEAVNPATGKATDAQSAQAQAVEAGTVAGAATEKPAAADTKAGAGVVEANGVKSYTEKFHGKVPEVTRISADKLEPKNTIEMSGARSSQEGSGLSPEAWAKTIDLAEPIKASVFSDGGVQVQDGHHRMLAAKILGKPLNVDLQAINAKPEAINGLIAESTTLSSQPKEINGTQAAKAIQTTQKGQAQPTTGEVNANPLQAPNGDAADPNNLPAAAVSAVTGDRRLPADRLEPALQPEPKMVQGVPEAVQALGKEVSRDIGTFKQGRSEANAKQTAKDLAKQNPALDYSVETDDKLKNGYVVVGRERVKSTLDEKVLPKSTLTPTQIEAKTAEVMRLVDDFGGTSITADRTRAAIQEKGIEAADKTIKGLTDLIKQRNIREAKIATQNIAPQATDTPAGGIIDKLIGMEEDAGSGFKKNDKAITIIKRAAENFTPEAKRKVNKVIAEYTSKQKNGDTLIKQGFYDAVYDEFAWTLDYLKNATNETIDVQNVAKPTPPGLAQMQAAKAVKDAAIPEDNNPQDYKGHKIYMPSMSNGFMVRDLKDAKNFGSYVAGPFKTKEEARANVDAKPAKPTLKQRQEEAKAKKVAAQPAIHKDPGEKAEAATAPVIAESLQKAQDWSKTRNGGKPSDMKANLLAQIDAAFKQTADYADYQKAVADRGQDVADSIFIKSSSNAGQTITEGKGQITFDVPGDGKFKIENSLRRLYEFRVNVEKSPGFKDTASAKYKFIRKEPGDKGSASNEAALANMLEERDFEAAMAYREATGTNLNDVKISPEARADLKAYLKEGTTPTVFSPAKDWKIEPGEYALEDTQNTHGASRTWEQDGHTYMARVYGNKDGARYSMQDNGAILVKDEGARNFIEAMQAAEEAPARLAAEQVAADKQRVMDEQKQAEGAKEAAKLLLQHTNGTGVFYDLRGVQNVKNRIAIMAALEGKAAYNYKESKAPSHLEIGQAFHKASKIERHQPNDVVDAAFQTWLKEVTTDKAAQEEVRVRREAQAEEAERQPTEHEGVKIYPTTFKSEPYWSVQIERNRGTDRMFGDTLHKTLEDAKKEASLQARNVKDLAERQANAAQKQAAVQAKKDANKGKSIVERHNDAVLDKRTTLPTNAGLGNSTRREAMQKAVEQERLIKAVMVEDNAAKKRDQEFVDRNRNLPTGNINYPGVKEYFEAKDRLQANKYEKPDYRVYMGRSDRDSFYNISKIEYDYVQKLKEDAEAQSEAKPQEAATAAPVAKDDSAFSIEGKTIDDATGNNGNFDPTKPDIRYSQGSAATGNFPYNEANREKTDKLQQVIDTKGHGLTITPVSVNAADDASGKSTGNSFKLAEELAGIFDKEIVWMTSQGDFTINGVVVGGGDLSKYVFIDATTNKPAHVVLGHELTHHIEKDAPQVYKALTQAMSGLLRNHAGYRQKYGIEGASEADTVKEMIGDMMGDNFDKREFWNRVSQESNGLSFQMIARSVMKWLDNLVLKLKGFGSDQFTNNVHAARKALATALVDYKASQGKPAMTNEGNIAPDFSENEKFGNWYSELGRQVLANKANAMPAGMWSGWIDSLKTKGVKPDEIEWSGVQDWLKLQTGKVTKADVSNYLNQNGVQVQETVLGATDPDIADVLTFHKMDNAQWGGLSRGERTAKIEEYENSIGNGETKYSQYQLPGGTNYREVLLTLPEDSDSRRAKLDAINDKYNAVLDGRSIQELPDAQRAEIERLTKEHDAIADAPMGSDYKSSHWEQPNVLAHIRVNDRTDASGARVLFVEEIQSDWGQDGKKKGFAKNLDGLSPKEESRFQELLEDGRRNLTGEKLSEFEALIARRDAKAEDKQAVPTAPFVTATDKWLSLALKRIVKMAVDGGYDKVSFVNGEQSADRYDLSKQVESVSAIKLDNGEYDIAVKDNNGRTSSAGIHKENALSDVVGKDLATKIIADADGKRKTYTGLDLKIGGEGMKKFYDAIVPNTAKEVIRKLGGGQMESVSLPLTTKQATLDVIGSNGELLLRTDHDSQAWAVARENDGAKVIPTAPIDSQPTQPGFTLTDAMKDKASGGMPLFSRLDNFKAWFGNSRVKDMSGQAATVYHGTSSDFSVFDKLKLGTQTAHHATSKLGFFFTTNAEKAGSFAKGEGANVMAVNLRIENPYQMTVTEAGQITTEDMARAKREDLQKAGYDGIRIANGGIWVAFESNQIKSATGNSGEYGQSDDIRFSRSGIAGQTNRQYTDRQQRGMKNVGFNVTPPTLKERAQVLQKDLGKKLAQGLVDQFAPVKALDKTAYGLLRLAKGASGAFEAFLHGGKLSLTDNVYDFDGKDKGGVIDKLLIPLQGEHHDMMRWVAANRAERLMGEGKEQLFSKQDIADLKTLSDGETPFDYTIKNGVRKGQITRNRESIYKDSLVTFNEFHKNILDLAEQSGLIDGASRQLWEHEFYVPFYRVADEADGGVRGMNIKGGAVRQQAFQTLKGGKNALNADLLDNTLMNWAHLLDASAKNRAAKATIEAAEAMGAAVNGNQATLAQMGASIHNKNGVVWFMDGGQKRFSLIDDPYLMTALTSLEYAGMRNPVMNAMGMMKHALTIGVTASPFFKVRNLIRDSVQVIGTSQIGVNPLSNIAQGWKLTDPKSDAYFKLLAGGGTIHFGTMLEGSEAKRVQALVESGIDASTILGDEHKIKAFYRKYIEPGVTAYNELGNRGEAINRAALYDQLVKGGMNHADASLQARDLMDFSMQGSFTSVRFLTQVVPFFNARIQGMYKLGRAAKEDPARFSAVIGAAALVSIGLLAAYGDDDDWKKREEWDRNNFWWFKFGGTAFRIPKPFEIGAVATLAERGFELAFDKEMTNKRFMAQVMTLLGDNLAMNPVPQMVKPMMDVYANTDSFSGRPIESMGMDKLKSDYRFNDRSSMTARAASTAMNSVTGLVNKEGLSPVQIDHMLRGYFGWLGSFIVGAGDLVARPATGQITQATPDYWKTATGSMASDLRDAPSRYVSQMYTQAKEIEQAYGTWRALQKEGKFAEAASFFADNKADIVKYKSVEHVKRIEGQLTLRRRQIERSDMDPSEKRNLLRAISAQQDKVARLVTP